MDSDGLLIPSMNIIYSRQGDKQMKEKDTKRRIGFLFLPNLVVRCILSLHKRTNCALESPFVSTTQFSSSSLSSSIFIFDEVSRVLSTKRQSIVKSNYESYFVQYNVC